MNEKQNRKSHWMVTLVIGIIIAFAFIGCATTHRHATPDIIAVGIAGDRAISGLERINSNIDRIQSGIDDELGRIDITVNGLEGTIRQLVGFALDLLCEIDYLRIQVAETERNINEIMAHLNNLDGTENSPNHFRLHTENTLD